MGAWPHGEAVCLEKVADQVGHGLDGGEEAMVLGPGGLVLGPVYAATPVED